MPDSLDIAAVEKAERFDKSMQHLFDLYMRAGYTNTSMEEYLAEPAADY